MSEDKATPAGEKESEGAAPEAAKDAPAASEGTAAGLLPEASAVTEEKKEEAKPATAVNQDTPEWFLSDGVKGNGPPPEWYKADKFKTVEEQAKAYLGAEKRIGAFTGAPKDGKYETRTPDGLNVHINEDHPLLGEFQKWAAEKQLSQDGYNEVIGMLAQYEDSLVPTVDDLKTAIGENADARILDVARWGKANLKPDEYEVLRTATSGNGAAAAFKVIEAVIAKTRQVRIPAPGADVPGSSPTGEADINALQAKIGPDGRRLYETDAKYRAEVEAKRAAFYRDAQARQMA